jgi:hypothetical protein
MNARICWPGVALLLALTESGCNRSGLVSATGKLTYKGQPVPSTRVIFQPDDGSRRSTGLTDDGGKFTLQFSRTESGVKPGRHKVFLRYEVSPEEELRKIPPKASKELRAVIDRYGDPKKSPLQYEVTESGQFFDIELK